MKLYNFFRSSTSHRLRIALNLKGITTEYIPVDLRVDEQLGQEFKKINPQGFVPALIDGDQTLIQSPAIIEWLEERYPEHPLLPKDINDRAHVRALAAIVGCDIHPLNNRRILETLRHQFACDDAAINAWCAKWISAGFDALEALLKNDPRTGDFCFGNTPTIADIYLVSQVESSKRFKVDVNQWPTIARIDAHCMKLEAFQKAAPLEQPDSK